jgi:hypothetical protein
MGQTAERDDLLLDALVNNLIHPGRYIRTEALKALDALGNPAAVPALIELLRFGVTYDTPLGGTSRIGSAGTPSIPTRRSIAGRMVHRVMVW